jgi:hypothetical protein
MNLGTVLGLALMALCLCFTQSFRIIGLRDSVRRLERKLNAIVKQQGMEWPSLVSPEVQLMAQDPRRKIIAIKLHREQNPDLSLSEAKKDVEDCILGK